MQQQQQQSLLTSSAASLSCLFLESGEELRKDILEPLYPWRKQEKRGGGGSEGTLVNPGTPKATHSNDFG